MMPAQTMPGMLLQQTLDAIIPIDAEAVTAAEARQLTLIKPPGALGKIEWVGNRLCGIARTCPPPYPRQAATLVFAGDHGVFARGVSPWAQELTVQMATNQATGHAGCSVLSREMGASVQVIDVGVLGDTSHVPQIRQETVRAGTADITVTDAMTRDECVAAMEVGIRVAAEAVDAGAHILVPGEMGIGNTTTAAALVAALTGLPAHEVTGRGGGSHDAMLARKIAAVADAVALHPIDELDGIGVMAALGGLEIAAMTGAMLAGAARHVPVIVDGVMAAAAALVARMLCTDVVGYLIAGHLGVEPGIKAALDALGLEPLVDLGLRLGEATGGLMALPVVRAGAAILNDMATFDEAAVNSHMRED